MQLLVSRSSSKTQRMGCSLVFVPQVCDRFTDFEGCLQLWEELGPVTKDFRDAGRTTKESSGSCSDLGCVLKLRISQSGAVD